MIRLTLRELRVAPAQHIATLIVTTLGAVLATIVIETNQVLAGQSVAGGFTRHGFVRLLLDVLGSVFLFVAIFVSCIVIANTFGIVMASRSKRIALLRLLGAEGRVLRRGVALEGVVVGALGGLLGTLLGLSVAAGLVVLLTNVGTFVAAPSPLWTPLLVAPVLIAIATTAGAAWFGSRRVSAVTPLEATGVGQEASLASSGAAPAPGSATRASASGSSAFWPVSRSELVLRSGSSSPPRPERSASSGSCSETTPCSRRSSASSAESSGGRRPPRSRTPTHFRHPARSARSTVGLVIGVTLVTMFSVAAACFNTQAGAVAASAPPQEAASDASFVTLVLGVLGVLIGFSLAIAAVGLVNSLSLSVLQRKGGRSVCCEPSDSIDARCGSWCSSRACS